MRDYIKDVFSEMLLKESHQTRQLNGRFLNATFKHQHLILWGINYKTELVRPFSSQLDRCTNTTEMANSWIYVQLEHDSDTKEELFFKFHFRKQPVLYRIEQCRTS